MFVEEFDEALKNQRVSDAGILMKCMYNILLNNEKTNQELSGQKNSRESVIEVFGSIAKRLNFKFELELKDGDITYVRWFYKDTWIKSVNGIIKPVIPGSNLGPKRSPINTTLRHEVFKKDGYRCVECGALEMLEVDHIIPVSQGGSDELDNLQTLCRTCNRAKGSRAWYGHRRQLLETVDPEHR